MENPFSERRERLQSICGKRRNNISYTLGFLLTSLHLTFQQRRILSLFNQTTVPYPCLRPLVGSHMCNEGYCSVTLRVTFQMDTFCVEMRDLGGRKRNEGAQEEGFCKSPKRGLFLQVLSLSLSILSHPTSCVLFNLLVDGEDFNRFSLLSSWKIKTCLLVLSVI